MRIGPKKDFERNDWTYDWEGLIYDNPRFGSDLLEFIISQFARFQIPLPPKELIDYCIQTAWTTLIYHDPYIWFYDTTDVTYTNDWLNLTYDVINIDGEMEECDPEYLHTFRFRPGHDEVSFTDILSKPGLGSLPCGDLLIDELSGLYSGESIFEMLSPQALVEMKRICHGCSEGMLPFADLACWATLAYLFGPYSRDTREECLSIFEACYNKQECIVYKGCVYTPEEYVVHKRAPHSCIVCGLESWCVELVYVDGMSRYMCEHHVNGGKSQHELQCGTKFCRHTECTHHPMYGKDFTQLDYVRKTHGFKQGMVEWDSERPPKQISFV